MHYPTLLLAFLLATTTNTVLATDPYVHSFFNADCTGPDAGDKVSLKPDNCVKFDSTYDAVEVNFGTTLDEFDDLEVFSDENCEVYAGKDVMASHAGNTPALCVSQSANGAKWGSVLVRKA